ncbi:DUF3995 domain-containing protein [Nocardioides sp. CPCC 205120]|uniref:DUF3995 domain-containing protein n=1 Tax=Nocardioides sp. CPCC 205120 TaxID=3406462 RepID=UPI003B502E49
MTGSRNGWLVAAGAAGLVHAAFSAYWALGGTWLLGTVGRWAVEWTREAPAGAGVVLATVAAVKVAGAVVPLLVEAGRLPGRRAWRGLSWAGAVVLVGYGTANAVGAWLVLTGLAGSGGGDRTALLGHAVLWDPLFALWGALLATGLWTTRDDARR